jgi:hypothetical protein
MGPEAVRRAKMVRMVILLIYELLVALFESEKYSE